MNGFDLSQVCAQARDKWRMRMSGASFTLIYRFTWKMTVTAVCVCVLLASLEAEYWIFGCSSESLDVESGTTF